MCKEVIIKQQIIERNDELRKEVEKRSKNKNPQYYHALMNYSWSKICVALLNNEEPSEDDVNYVCRSNTGTKALVSSTTLPKSLQNAIDDGSITTMNVMDILDRYRDSVPGFHDMLQNALKKAGYKCKGFKIVKS